MQKHQPIWEYLTPGIDDHLFETSPGISMNTRTTRLLILSYLKIQENSVIWNIGAGTGTLLVEIGLICPRTKIIAIERDEEIIPLIEANCVKFGISNVEILAGTAPHCFTSIPHCPDRVVMEVNHCYSEILVEVWNYLRIGGKVVVITSHLSGLYKILESLNYLKSCHLEVVQSSIYSFPLSDQDRISQQAHPLFLVSAEKLRI